MRFTKKKTNENQEEKCVKQQKKKKTKKSQDTHIVMNNPRSSNHTFMAEGTGFNHGGGMFPTQDMIAW